MTLFGSRHDEARGVHDAAGTAPGAHGKHGARRDGTPGDGTWEGRHRRALVLSEVVAEGQIGLFRVLRRAASGDSDAAQVRVAALVRALPGLGTFECHDLLVRAQIHEAALAGDLTPGQRVALVEAVERRERLRNPRPPTAASA